MNFVSCCLRGLLQPYPNYRLEVCSYLQNGSLYESKGSAMASPTTPRGFSMIMGQMTLRNMEPYQIAHASSDTTPYWIIYIYIYISAYIYIHVCAIVLDCSFCGRVVVEDPYLGLEWLRSKPRRSSCPGSGTSPPGLICRTFFRSVWAWWTLGSRHKGRA